MTLRRTLPVTAACAALFGASFVAGNALLDDKDSPRARPTRQAPPADSGQPAVRRQLALALGRAAGLPGLRTPPPPVKKSPAKKSPAQGGAAPAQPAAAAPPVRSPVLETQPVATPAPTPNSPPPAPPGPTKSSPPTSSAPRPDAPPRAPQPTADPAPSGGASYEPEEE